MLLFGSSCCSDGWRRDAGGITYAGSFAAAYLEVAIVECEVAIVDLIRTIDQ